MCAVMAEKTIKIGDSNVSLAIVTATTESLGFSNNGFKIA